MESHWASKNCYCWWKIKFTIAVRLNRIKWFFIILPEPKGLLCCLITFGAENSAASTFLTQFTLFVIVQRSSTYNTASYNRIKDWKPNWNFFENRNVRNHKLHTVITTPFVVLRSITLENSPKLHFVSCYCLQEDHLEISKNAFLSKNRLTFRRKQSRSQTKRQCEVRKRLNLVRSVHSPSSFQFDAVPFSKISTKRSIRKGFTSMNWKFESLILWCLCQQKKYWKLGNYREIKRVLFQLFTTRAPKFVFFWANVLTGRFFVNVENREEVKKRCIIYIYCMLHKRAT